MNDCPRTDSKWWGWGANDKRLPLSEEQLAPLRDELGVDAEAMVAVPAIEQVKLPEPTPLPAAITTAVGADAVLTGQEQRIRHAAGKSYPDLVRMRSGSLAHAPDAVVVPAEPKQLESVLAACAAENVAVVPFGGGTSVVGGVDPNSGGRDRVIALDLCRLRDVSVDRVSMTARLGPGLRGPEAEAALGAEGMTLGHFPQSFEYATIGGFAATRSAGQASSGYGRFDEVVTAIDMIAPAGRLSTLQTPHTAAGPSIRELVLGSEGVFGVIDEVTVRVRPSPQERRYETWFASDFEAGREIIRSLAQSDCLADITRLSDEEETRFSLGLAVGEGGRRSALDAYLRLRRRKGGCMMILGWEGEGESVRRRRALSVRTLRDGGAVPLGQSAGRSWEHGRYDGPYLRDELLDRGVMVETLETSHTWSRVPELYEAVRGALRGALERGGTPPIVFCHLSHGYADGASLYFTFLARQRRGEEIEQWREAKTAACEAIVGAG
ncbi:MAG: alkyldihydroxyacetonephosphate synthase, partial [Solirubrobacterales bacterium]|nr:alkyldihydroxyacetonephosphate synthase [Solirubrobacterales bacterium]